MSATFLLAGWTKGEEPQHVIKLVDAASLASCRAKLDPITALHVYSVQPTQPKARLHALCYPSAPCNSHNAFLGMPSRSCMVQAALCGHGAREAS